MLNLHLLYFLCITVYYIFMIHFRHNEAVQAMQFNPVSHQLLSCSLSDIAFWSPEQKAVVKHKSRGRVNCCAWTSDGQYLAIGLASGYVSIRNKVCLFYVIQFKLIYITT